MTKYKIEIECTKCKAKISQIVVKDNFDANCFDYLCCKKCKEMNKYKATNFAIKFGGKKK